MGTGRSTAVWSQDITEGGFCGWQRQVDQICDQFEALWADGEEPRIEDLLESYDLPPSRRTALLCELLKLENELRQGRGEHPTAQDYLDRFPDQSNVIRAVFGESRLGAYDLVGLIGEGGMGSVYRAYDPTMRRTVALKVIRSSRLDDSSAMTRFRLEAQLAGRLDHEHIVPVFEAGQVGSQLFYTMRYIQGWNLSELIHGKALEGRRAAHFIEQVARAVDYAHGQGILHRDLKPSNILIDSSDRAYVTDFGLAKVLEQTTRAETQSTDRLGTLAYMAPEQARNPTRAVIESDVYSLGATLYEAITGRPPFQAESLVATLKLVEEQAPVPPRRVNPRVDRDLETICLKCLEKEPCDRFSSSLELAQELRRFLDYQPIKVRPANLVERLKKWVKRNPTAAALLAVSLLLLVALMGIVQTQRLTARVNAALASSDEGYKIALTSMEDIARFAERRLSDRPEDLKDLLAIVLRLNGDYLARRRDDPRFALSSAMALTRVARILNLSGMPARALEVHQQALHIRQALATEAPRDLNLRADLAETWHDIGILHLAVGRADEAIEAYRRALDIREDLVSRVPSDRSFLSDLARSHGYIGDWERQRGRLDRAKGSYGEALRIRERLFEEDPSDPSIRFQLARSYNNSGHLEREGGFRDRALEWHEKALKLQRELIDLDPEEALHRLEADKKSLIKPTDFQSDLASTHGALGIILAELGRIPEAKREHEEALALLDWLAVEYPGVPKYQGERAWTWTHLGALRGSADDLKRAEEVFRSLVRDHPNVTRFRAGEVRNMAARGELLVRAGSPTGRDLLLKAREELSRLVEANPENFDYRSDLMDTEELLRR